MISKLLINLKKDACTTCKDAINDTIASMKADLGILHETVRIKTIECQKLNQYCSGVERNLVYAREGIHDYHDQLVFNQGDHTRIAHIANSLKDIKTMIKSHDDILKNLCEINQGKTSGNEKDIMSENTGCPENSAKSNKSPL